MGFMFLLYQESIGLQQTLYISTMNKELTSWLRFD